MTDLLMEIEEGETIVAALVGVTTLVAELSRMPGCANGSSAKITKYQYSVKKLILVFIQTQLQSEG